MIHNRTVALVIWCIGGALLIDQLHTFLVTVFLITASVWILLLVLGRSRYTDEPHYPYDAAVHDRANQ